MEIKLQDGTIVSDIEFRQSMPNVSMPAVLTKEVLALFGALAVMAAPQPSFDPATQRVQRNGVVQDALGNTVQAWEVIDLLAEEVASLAAAAAEARIVKFTPPQIIAALETMGVAGVILANTDDLTKAKFYTASSVREDDERLLAALGAVGKTIDELKAAVT